MIQSGLGIKSWLCRPPGVAEARPATCVGCRKASCPVGERIRVHGQGRVARQVRGPLSVGGAAELVTILARKYECQDCFAVMTVVPCGVLPGRLYSGQAIALALWLFVVEALSGVAVRSRISPWRVAGRSGRRVWAQLYRWVRDAGHLFRTARPVPEAACCNVVQRVLWSLVAMAPAGLVAAPDVARMFAGAAMIC